MKIENKIMKQSIDTAQLNDSINLVELVEKYNIELRHVSGDEWHGPCPWCGGDDRFRVTTKFFACRLGGGHCGEHGRAIQFVIKMENIGFKEAVAKLSGGYSPEYRERIKPAHDHKPVCKPVFDWDEPAEKRKALEAHDNLVRQDTSDARRCMAYLNKRGIGLDTIRAFTIGCKFVHLPDTWQKDDAATHPPQLAVSMPWFNPDGAVVAMKYRFIASHTYTDKYGEKKTANKTSRGGMAGNCFGWQNLRGPDKCSMLIVVEGEMNALSLWQASGGAIDIICPGNEAQVKRLPPIVKDLAARYKHRLVWADQKPIADAAAIQIGGVSRFSLEGKDASDLLKAGELRSTLTNMFSLMNADVSIPHHTVVIVPGHSLFMPPSPTATSYRAWLWSQMDEQTGNPDVLAAIYDIANLITSGESFRIVYPHADIIQAAAQYEIGKQKIAQ